MDIFLTRNAFDFGTNNSHYFTEVSVAASDGKTSGSKCLCELLIGSEYGFTHSKRTTAPERQTYHVFAFK